MSASNKPTVLSLPKTFARQAAIVDLPTPPLADAIAIIFFIAIFKYLTYIIT